MQKFTIKALLKSNKKNPKGRYPVYIRITIDRKSSFLSTGHYILKKHWDDASETVINHALADEINTDILQKKREVMQNMIEAGVKGEQASSIQIKERSSLADLKHNFFHFADNYTQDIVTKRKGGTIANYKKHLKKLEEFNDGKELTFEQITTSYLNKFERYLTGEGVNRRKDNSNYAHAVIKTIRRFFTAAIKKGLTSHYPFSQYEMPDYTPGDKDHLTLPELDKWTKYYKTTKDPIHKEVALYFLFGCYSGLRISDWYLFDLKKRVHADHISLRAKKNEEWISVPMHSRLKWVLGEMKSIPLRIAEPDLNRKLKTVADKAGVNKRLSSHCARKTFAVTICLERGVSSETAAELMGITLDTFVKSYSKVTAAKMKKETAVAWKGL